MWKVGNTQGDEVIPESWVEFHRNVSVVCLIPSLPPSVCMLSEVILQNLQQTCFIYFSFI